MTWIRTASSEKSVYYRNFLTPTSSGNCSSLEVLSLPWKFYTQGDPMQLDCPWFHQYLVCFLTIQSVFGVDLNYNPVQRDTIMVFLFSCDFIVSELLIHVNKQSLWRSALSTIEWAATWYDITGHFICLSNLEVVCSCAQWKRKTLIELYHSSTVTWHQDWIAHGFAGRYAFDVLVLSGHRLYCI